MHGPPPSEASHARSSLQARDLLPCPSCSQPGGSVVHRQHGIPVHSCMMVSSVEEARAYPRGNMALTYCSKCGFFWNSDFDPAAVSYRDGYEETLIHSPTFRSFLERQVQYLVERYELRNKDVLEIGCGKGEFLLELCRCGGNRGVGLDPGFEEGRYDEGDVRFIKDLYSESYTHLSADFFACRHTLEHIPDAGQFIAMVRRAIGERSGASVFFELPAMERILDECAFWDIYYEHCSYFTLGSLSRLFRSSGFRVEELRHDYGDQYLFLVSRPSPAPVPEAHPAEEGLAELAERVARFERELPRRLAKWRRQLDEWQARGRRVALWGSGSKAVSYLNNLDVGAEVDLVVDINPHKHGKYLAGSGHRIAAPGELSQRPPDVVLVMNPIYVPEIRDQLQGMKLNPEVLALQ